MIDQSEGSGKMFVAWISLWLVPLQKTSNIRCKSDLFHGNEMCRKKIRFQAANESEYNNPKIRWLRNIFWDL